MAMQHPEERAQILARRKLLVGNVLAASDQEQAIEASFESQFGAQIPEPRFWRAFEQACCAVYDGQPWHMPRQLMLSNSLPQQINAKDERGETMMTLAASFDRPKIVNILCQIKGDPRIENAKGWSTPHVAAAYNHVDVLKALINLGVSINEPDSRLGYMPIHLAAAVDNVEVLDMLNQSGKADFTTLARNGYSVLHVASAHGSDRCVKFLLEKHPKLVNGSVDHVLNESPAHKAAKHLNTHVYRQLVDFGARDDLENIQDDSAKDMAKFNARRYY